MQIYDWAVVVVLGLLAFRGWRRGFVREAIELAVLFFGSLLAFRLSPAIGSIISGMANVSYEIGRIVGGVIVFIALIVASVFVARFIALSLKVLPGATTLNRVGGAVVGAVYGFILVAITTTLVAAAPLPESVAASVDTTVAEAKIGSVVSDPDGAVQSALAAGTGESLYRSVIAVRDAVGDRLMAGTIPIPIPEPGDADLRPSQTDAQAVFDDLNAERMNEGLDPLGWSADLGVVAVTRATQVYRSGWLSLDDRLAAVLAAEGIPGTIHGEMVAMAASPDGVSEAFLGASAYVAELTDPAYRLAGVGVVDGPYGLVTVVVLSA